MNGGVLCTTVSSFAVVVDDRRCHALDSAWLPFQMAMRIFMYRSLRVELIFGNNERAQLALWKTFMLMFPVLLPNVEVDHNVCVCVKQVSQRIPVFQPEVSPHLVVVSTPAPTSLPSKQHFVLTFHSLCLLSWTALQPHSVFVLFFFYFVYFCVCVLCLFSFFPCSCVCVFFGCGLCADWCLCVCVFSSCLRWLRFLCRQMQHLARAA